MSESLVVGTALKDGLRQVTVQGNDGNRVYLKLHPYALVAKATT
jgi:hypothetical protein